MSQEETKISLEEYITSLESYRESASKLVPKAKEWLDDADIKMRETTELIQNQFAAIREAINKKEEEIMHYLEMKENDNEATRKLIYNAQELMCEVPTIVGDAKTLLEGWDMDKELTTDATDKVASIKEKVESGNKIVKKLRTFEDCKIIIDTERFVNGMKRGLEEINRLQDVSINRVLCSPPTGLALDMTFSLFICLCWTNTGKFDEFLVSTREEGGEWRDGDDLIHIDNKKDYCVVYPLKPNTKYEFRVKGRIEDMETEWSDTVSGKTTMKFVIPAIECIVQGLPKIKDNLHMLNAVIDSIGNMALKGGETQQRAFGEAGAIESILSAIRTHINDVNLCINGCDTLAILLRHDGNQMIAGACGLMETVVEVMKTHINNEKICVSGCGMFWTIATEYINQIKIGETDALEMIVNAMKTHMDHFGICFNGCGAFMNITEENFDNQVKAGKSGAIEVILDVMKKHADNVDLCYNGCYALACIVLNNSYNQAIAEKSGAVDVILNSMMTHANNTGVCIKGCRALWSLSLGNTSIQRDICEKGGLVILVFILSRYITNESIVEMCCGTLGMVLSSQETQSKYCTPDVLITIKGCYENNRDSKDLEQFYYGLTKVEDETVKDAVARGVCTKELYPKCRYRCACDKGVHCPKCCVQQKAFKCLTCDKNEKCLKLYCETCWKKGHQGHECEEFFCPVRCSSK